MPSNMRQPEPLVTSSPPPGDRGDLCLHTFVRQVNMAISLAFLAPGLVQAAVDGRLPRGIGVANLRDAPAAWSLQYGKLGLAS